MDGKYVDGKYVDGNLIISHLMPPYAIQTGARSFTPLSC